MEFELTTRAKMQEIERETGRIHLAAAAERAKPRRHRAPREPKRQEPATSHLRLLRALWHSL